MIEIAKRSYQAELIDDLNLSNEALRQNLEELATINKWLGGNEVTTSGLKKLFESSNIYGKNKTIKIADIGCGGGDMLNLMAKWAVKQNISTAFIGIDANQFMIDFAKNRSIKYKNITYLKEDAFSENIQNLKLDVATMTLFCHHFTESQLITLFTHLRKNCSIGIIINDLHRHWFAYYSIAWLTAIFSKSYLVKNDAKLSVWRGFRKPELEQILAEAGFNKYTIKWRWAFRWEIVAYC